MNEYSEKRLYISRLITAYTGGKNVCDALDECGKILPEESVLRAKVTTCIRMLMTGEGLPEDAPLKSSLSMIDEGEPSLVILHDMIVHSEMTGKISEENFIIYEEMISYIDDKNRCENKRAHRKKDKLIVTYERLKKCRRKNASNRLRKELIKSMKNDLVLCMTSMMIYTRMLGVEHALKRTCSLTNGLIKNQLKSIRKRYESGENIREISRDFLCELELPELNQCLTDCFMDNAEHCCMPISGELFLREEKRARIILPRKEICAVMMAVIVGSMGIMGMLLKDDKKEGRLKDALSKALVVAVGDMKEERGTNQIMAGFMQQMLKQVDDDIDLTVRICDLDKVDQTMEVEAIGEYDSFLGDRRRISVRRRLSF